MIWIAIVGWFAASAADLITSVRINLFADLREGDPLARNAQGQFSLGRGLMVSAAEGAILIAVAAFAGGALGAIVLLAAAAAHGFAAIRNWSLEAHDTTPKSKGWKIKNG
ncbi:MAG: hypothetical protein ACLGP3_02280 [Acidobacteriota bacterium]